jgi:hypothetical protein
MIKFRFFLIISIIGFFISCDNKHKNSLNIHVNNNYDNSKFIHYNLITPSNQIYFLVIDSIGNLIGISNDTIDDHQSIKFNSLKKVSNIFNYKNNKLDGRAYYFNENSGFLDGDFNYTNGIKSGNAVLYYDSSAMLKETMLYNDFGELYFREKYDRNGKVIGREGNDGSDSIK